MNKKVPLLQKIFAYLIIVCTIFTFTLMRTNKNKANFEKQELFKQQVELSLTNSLYYLYNNDLEKNTCDFIDDNFYESITSKFSKPNLVMKESNLTLTNITLSKNRIYNTTKKGVKYIIYDGLVELEWINTNNNIKTDPTIKKIIGYILKKDNKYTVVDIDLQQFEK